MLYKGESVASRGSLSHLKVFYNHNSMKTDVKANFQHAWDLMEVRSQLQYWNTYVDFLHSHCPSLYKFINRGVLCYTGATLT